MCTGKRVPEQPATQVHLELFLEQSCYFFGFDHPTKLLFRLDQDWGADQLPLWLFKARPST